jgi:hypothetical protein
MYRSIGGSMLAVACLLLAGCREGTPSIAGCEADGTAVALNRGPGLWDQASARAELVERWRSDPANGQTRLGFPAALAASPSGRLAVADFELDRVTVLSGDGRPLGAWPRDHRLVKPVAVTWDDGDRLHILDLGASLLLVTDADGALFRTEPVSEVFLDAAMSGGGLAWAGVLAGGSVYFQPLAGVDREAEDPGRSRWTIWRQRAGGVRVDTIADAPARLFGYTMIAPLPVPTWPQLRAATGGTGILALGGEDGAYRIRLFHEDGTPLRTVCREADPLPPSAQERGEVEGENLAELLREAPQPESPAPYGHFFVGADDHLWVQRDRPFGVGADPFAAIHGNPGGRFDVFDPEGRYLGELRAPDGVRLRAAAGDRVWGIHAGEAEDPRIVGFQLVTR